MPSSSTQAGKPRDVRLRQGAALLGGAALLQVAVAVGPLSFFWTPFFVGLAYLAAALAGGRRGGHWATATVLLPWGTTSLRCLSSAASTSASPRPISLPWAWARCSLGCCSAADSRSTSSASEERSCSPGLFFGLDRYWVSILGRADTYAALIAVVGLWNVAAAARAPRVRPALDGS